MAEATVGLLRVVLASNSAQFDAGMDKSSGKVEAFGRAGRSAAASLSKLVNDFNGTKVTAEATRMATAIEKVGGVSKLTDGDLSRVNRTLDAAIAKYRVMGTEVPPHITKLKTEVAALDKASDTAATGGIGKFSGALGMVGRLLPALGFAGAVTSLVSLGRAALDSADKHVTFADKLGVSTETTQRWAYVAGQTGTTMEAFGNSAFKLGINVSTGTDKVRKAVGDLGIAYVELKNLKPEQQFDAVIKAMEGVESATERNRIGQTLFGKQFSEIAAAVASGYTRMKDEATIASDAQVRAAERAGDAWERFKGKIGALSLGVVGRLASDFMDTAAAVDTLSAAERDEFAVAQRMGEGHQYLIDLQHQRTKGMRDINLATDDGTAANADYVAKLAEVRAEVAGLTTSQKAQIGAAAELNQITDEFADTIGVSREAINLYQSSLKGGAKVTREFAKDQDDATRAAKEFAASVKSINSLSMRSTFGNVDTLPRLLEDSSDEIAEIRESMEAMDSISFNDTWVPFVQGASDAGSELARVSLRLREVSTLGQSIGDGFRNVYQQLTSSLSRTIFGLGHDMDGVLRRTAAQSTVTYRQILADGTSTPEQIANAFEVMQRDIDAANNTFKERFKDVWIDIKGTIYDVFDDILQQFVTRFLGGMVNAMAGQQGAWGNAFSGLIGRGAGGAAAGVVGGGGGAGGGAAASGGTGAAGAVGSVAPVVAGAVGAAAAGYFAGKIGQDLFGPGYKAGGVGAAGGAAAGALIGSVIPGLGTAVGGIIGGLVGFAAGFVGTAKEVKNARAEVDIFQGHLRSTLSVTQQQEAGGEKWKQTVIAVRDAYLATGRSAEEADAIVKQLWDTENPQRAAEAMQVISGIMLEQNAILQEKQRLIENTQEAQNIFDQIMEAGSKGIPAAYQPAIDKLIELGLLTDEQAKKLRDMPKVDVAGMEQAMAVLKGRIESLGPAFRQAKINETAMQYANAIQTLIDGGADWGSVMMDAKEELGELVEEALKSGTTLPANLKPYIDDLVASGNLLDKNGNKITDVSKIKYGEAQKTQAEIAKAGWDKILAAIQTLIDKIAGPLTDELDKATKPRTIPVTVEIDDPDGVWRERNPSERGRKREDGFAAGTIGRLGKWFGNFGRGTGITAHGMEAIVQPRQAIPFALDTLAGLIPEVRMPSFGGLTAATSGGASSTVNNFIMVPMPSDAVGDTYRMTRAVIRAVPSSIAMNEAGITEAIEKVYDNKRRTTDGR